MLALLQLLVLFLELLEIELEFGLEFAAALLEVVELAVQVFESSFDVENGLGARSGKFAFAKFLTFSSRILLYFRPFRFRCWCFKSVCIL